MSYYLNWSNYFLDTRYLQYSKDTQNPDHVWMLQVENVFAVCNLFLSRDSPTVQRWRTRYFNLGLT